MVVTCAFYGFINRTTKVTLQVDREELEVGQSFAFEGDNYVILSVFEADDQDRLDGLTVDCGDWWFNLRPSNTEPLLRLNLEAANPASRDARVAELRQLINPA